MKNPLADVLRQSSGNDHALSDSGSFDTRAPDLRATANDASIEAVDTAELELLESTGAVILDDGTISFQVHDENEQAPDAEFVAPVPQPKTNDFDPERAPPVSRFAPLICLGVAMLTVALWAAWTTVRDYSSESSIGANELPVSGLDNGSIAGTVHIAGAERFPFIDPEARSDAGEGE